MEHTLAERVYCEERIKYHEQPSDWCEPLWDTKLCWPAAMLNETIELPCPKREFANQTASRICMLYDEQSTQSSDARAIWSTGNYSACPHPENYSMLFMEIAKYKYHSVKDEMWEHKILTLSQFIYFISFIVLVVALSVFVLFEKLRNARTRLHMHVFSVMLMQVVMWLLHSFLFDNQLLSGYMYLETMSKINIHVAVKLAADYKRIAEAMFTRFNAHLDYIFIAGLERYFETATLFWLLMEGWFLHELICRKPLETITSVRRYVIIGWGVPILVTAPWMIVHLYSSYNDVYWTSHDSSVSLIAATVFATFMMNLYFFVKISSVLFTKMKLSVQMQQKKMEYKKWVRSTFMLVLLFGAQNVLYVIWFFIHKTKPKLLFLLVIKVISSFQGCFVSFIYCFLNQEVRTVLKKNFIG